MTQREARRRGWAIVWTVGHQTMTQTIYNLKLQRKSRTRRQRTRREGQMDRKRAIELKWVLLRVSVWEKQIKTKKRVKRSKGDVQGRGVCRRFWSRSQWLWSGLGGAHRSRASPLTRTAALHTCSHKRQCITLELWKVKGTREVTNKPTNGPNYLAELREGPKRSVVSIYLSKKAD